MGMRALASPMDEGPVLGEISSRKRILIVDDDPAVLDALSFALEECYDTQTCRDGAHTLALLYVFQPDPILLDLKMKGLDGIQVLGAIRRTHHTLPVVIMTGWSSQDSAERAADLGVSGYLKKPFDIDHLFTRLADILAHSTHGSSSFSDPVPPPQGSFRPLVRQALSYLHQNFSRRLTLPEIAAALDVTPGHLCHVFKREVGRTPMAYLNEIRIEWGKILLRNGARPVSAIAYELGFAYPHYFSQLFKACTGSTPGQFR